MAVKKTKPKSNEIIPLTGGVILNGSDDSSGDSSEFMERVGKDVRSKPSRDKFPAKRDIGHGDVVSASDTDPELMDGNSRPIKNIIGNSMWAKHGNNFFGCEQAIYNMPAGQYICIRSDHAGFGFQQVSKSTDVLMHLPDTASEDVINSMKHFWSREEAFRDYGFLWKRGILLYGPPGSGKTATVTLISDYIQNELDGICIFVQQPGLAAKCLALLREIEPTRLLVCILEDIDSIIDQYGEPDLLALMDGETQLDNIVFVATTNYPERLDKRFVNRPSRFDIIRKIDMPSADARSVYLRNKLPEIDEDTLVLWVKETNGYSIAHLKEVIVSVYCLDNTFESTIKRLNKMIDQKLSSDHDEDRTFGFVNNKKEE